MNNTTSKSSSRSSRTIVKPQDKRQKGVTIDNPQSDFYSSDDVKWFWRWFKLKEPSLSSAIHEQGGPSMEESITVACIMDYPTIMVHAGKCYKALIDSGANISLLGYCTYKNIGESCKTPYSPLQPNWTLQMVPLWQPQGMTALHLRIVEFKFTNNFVICNRLSDTEIIFSIAIQKKFTLSYTWDKEKNCYIQRDGKFLTYTRNCE